MVPSGWIRIRIRIWIWIWSLFFFFFFSFLLIFVFFSSCFQDSEDGLYVCMNRFLGFGRSYVERYQQKTGHQLFLHLKRIRKRVAPSANDEDGGDSANGDKGVPEKVSRLAIGVEGGFNPDVKKYDYTPCHSIVLVPEFTHFDLGAVSVFFF